VSKSLDMAWAGARKGFGRALELSDRLSNFLTGP
jgi:hypothetical protein